MGVPCCEIIATVRKCIVIIDMFSLYSHSPHNDVSVNYGLHIRQWSYKIIII